MYECRCPNDGKKLAEISRPPLSMLRYEKKCACGRGIKGKVEVDPVSGWIIGKATCTCGRTYKKVLGYLVRIKCRRCKEVIGF